MTVLSPSCVSAPSDTLAALVYNLRTYLSPIKSSDVHVSVLKSIISQYKYQSDEWTQFGGLDWSKPYTRLGVDTIDGKSNLLFLLWHPGSASPIHDHADSHCVMKILQGSLRETVFEKPNDKDLRMKIKSETDYVEGQMTYITDNIGIHRCSNNAADDLTVSLHLYTPPNAADYGFHTYCPQTCQKSYIAGALTKKIQAKI